MLKDQNTKGNSKENLILSIYARKVLKTFKMKVKTYALLFREYFSRVQQRRED
jgi:hypothetical protein